MEYDEWLEKNEDDLWVRWHETLAVYDTDFDKFCESEYEGWWYNGGSNSRIQ